ncbi:hypothetical protein PV04_10110 [Phialophora macrospora]|uniref:Ubiquitin 3 binding protein But2 C-terminal domain-containing protein n=1 Tax=Phialophora macrospora TaxID=1851006 RepID=A0A0D2F5R2_9EURO|nr:hypothetical protein PV04_10110 [Phialophora macrospora]
MLSLSRTTVALIATIVGGTHVARASPTSTWSDTSPSLCQFFSSIPGVDPTDTRTMTLPPCPSSLVSVSYTIPPPAGQTTPAVPSPESQDGGAAATICQFYSSIPGVDPTDAATMTLPPCPSSLVSFSYTIPPPAAQTTPATPSPGTVCQFYSSVDGLQSPIAPETTLTLPPCPSSLQHVTYTYQAPVGAAATTTSAVLEAVSTTAVSTATYSGLAPRHGVDGSVLGGALAVLAAAIM